MKTLCMFVLLAIPAYCQFSNARSIQGVPVGTVAPADGQAICYQASSKSYIPAACTNAGPTGPAGPAPVGTGAVVVNAGTAATVSAGASGHTLVSNGTQYVDAALTTAQVTESGNLYFTNARTWAAITLTTTGTSGAATFSGGVLNIPQYSGGSSSLLSGTLASIPATCTVGASLYQATDQPNTLQIYVCTATNTWTRAAYTQGSSNPATCTIGQLFVNTFAKLVELCTTTNTWTAVQGATVAVTSNALVGDGGGNAVAASGTGANCLHVDGTSGTCGSGAGAAAALHTVTVSGGVAALVGGSASAGTVDSFVLSAALAANTTSTFTTATSGEVVNITITQASSGGPFTFTVPSGFDACAVNTIASSVTTMTYWWDGTLGHRISCGSTSGPAIQTTPALFSTLPTCSSTYAGSIATISDSSTAVQGATITGSGSNNVGGYCNGTNWIVFTGSGGSTGTVTHTVGALASTALVTGNGGADIQTPNSGSTLDTSGNLVVASINTPKAFYNGTHNVTTGYTMASTDEAKLTACTGAGAVAISLPAASSGGFTNGAWFDLTNNATGNCTITPTTSTINGASTLVLPPGAGARLFSDSSNYTAQNWVNTTAGTVTTSGSPASGNLTKFSGSTAITNGDLTGDVTTSGTLATTIAASAVTNSKIANATIDLTTKVTGILPAANGGTGQNSGSSTGLAKVTSGTWSFVSSIRPVGCIFGDAATGSALTTSETCYVRSPVACTIVGYSILADAGTATVKTWRVATGGTAVPTVSNSISTSGVALSTGTAVYSTTVTDWTSTAVAANDLLAFNLSAVSTAKQITFQIDCQQ